MPLGSRLNPMAVPPVLLAERPRGPLWKKVSPWRKLRPVHEPRKVLLDVAPAVALGGDCLADVTVLRAESAAFGPAASDPTASRLIDNLAASGGMALQAIRSARSEVRDRVWSLAEENANWSYDRTGNETAGASTSGGSPARTRRVRRRTRICTPKATRSTASTPSARFPWVTLSGLRLAQSRALPLMVLA